MDIQRGIDNMLKPMENAIKGHLKGMKMDCHRLILLDSVLWTLFIIYYIIHFFYTKQYTAITKKHATYEKILKEKDIIIITFLLLALLLYFHFFILSKN